VLIKRGDHGRDGSGSAREFGAALGLTAGALLYLQFLSSGRFETLSGRIGIDRMMRFHRTGHHQTARASTL
jgi:hypothetical protein